MEMDNSSALLLEEVLQWIPSLTRFEDDDVLKAVNIVRDAKSRY